MRTLILGILIGASLTAAISWAGRFDQPRSGAMSEQRQYDRYLQDAYKYGPAPEWEGGRGPWGKSPC